MDWAVLIQMSVIAEVYAYEFSGDMLADAA